MLPRIMLDFGHGGRDSGATGFNLEEKNVVKDIGYRVANELRKYKCEINLTRSTDAFIPLRTRTKLANKWKANIFVSFHCNAGGGGKAEGYESFISRFASKKSRELQNNIHPGSAKLFRKDRGKKRKGFWVLVGTRMPSILLENGFINNRHDATQLKSTVFKNKLAKSIANGIVKTLNLKKRSGKMPRKLSEQERADRVYKRYYKGKIDDTSLTKKEESVINLRIMEDRKKLWFMKFRRKGK